MAGSATDEDEDLFEPSADEADELEQEGQDQDGEGDEPETDEEETFIGFPEDEPDEQDSSEPFRRIRQQNRELQAENRKLRQTQPEPKPVEVGPKPALADFDFDEDQYDAAMDGWRATKAAADKQAQAPDQKVQAAIEGATARFETHRSKIKVADFDQKLAAAKAGLGDDLTAGIVLVAENAPAVLYALGKSPARLDQIANADPSRLAYLIGALEKDLKVTTKKRAPEPDTPVRGSASLSPGKDKHLERLEAEADRTNDRTKVAAYKTALKRKG